MNTNGEVPSKEEINKRKNAIREYHQPLLDELGIPLVYVMGKMCMQDNDGNAVVFLYPTELEKGDDVYIEFTTRHYLPSTPERKLWKWKFNPNWKTLYPVVPGRDHRLVPFSEFTEVSFPTGSKYWDAPEDKRFELPVPGDEQDCPMKEMTMRDYMAIHMRIPVSLKTWLNKIVIENSK